MRRSMKFEGLETRKLMAADIGMTAPIADIEYVEVAGGEEQGGGDIIQVDGAGRVDAAEQWHGFLSDVAIWKRR